MLWLVLLGILYLLIWYQYVRPLSYWTNKGVKQSKPWIFFGDMWDNFSRKLSLNEFVDKLYKMYPHCRYSGFYQFSVPTLIIRDPELIKQVTIRDFDHFTDHKFFVNLEADPMWAGTLFALNGKKWREMRATLSGIFTSSKIKHMFVLMEETADNFIQYLLNKNENNFEMDFKDFFTRYTNDVIASAAYGIKVDSLKEPNNQFFVSGKDIANLNGIIPNIKIMLNLLVPKILSTLKIGLFSKKLTSFLENVINETIKVREEQGIVRPDLIQLMLEARKTAQYENEEDKAEDKHKEAEIGNFKQYRNITNEDITSQAFLFFLGGFETVATTMCFVAYELAINKDVQDRLREEIKKVYSRNGKLGYYDLLEMKYMDMVVSEVLRKWSIAALLERKCTKPYTIEPVTPDEVPVHLDVGDVIWIPVQGIHSDPAYYPNPEKFDPERFSDMRHQDNFRAYTYLPFGTGPRNCIGSRFALTEVKALLFNLLLHFEIVPTNKTSIPLKLKKNMFIIDADFWLGFKRLSS